MLCPSSELSVSSSGRPTTRRERVNPHATFWRWRYSRVLRSSLGQAVICASIFMRIKSSEDSRLGTACGLSSRATRALSSALPAALPEDSGLPDVRSSGGALDLPLCGALFLLDEPELGGFPPTAPLPLAALPPPDDVLLSIVLRFLPGKAQGKVAEAVADRDSRRYDYSSPLSSTTAPVRLLMCASQCSIR